MLILCTGMYRSGSTWSYNVCRTLMEAASTSVYCKYSENIEESLTGPATKYDHVVLKCHAVDIIGRGLIKHASCWSVYTFRDPMDAIWSGMDAFKESFDKALKNVVDSLKFLEFQAQTDDAHFIWYNDITDRPVERILMIADYLGVEPTPRLIKRMADEYDRERLKEKTERIGKVKNEMGEYVDDPTATAIYDKKTLFNKGHVRVNNTSGYDMLSDEQFDKAMAALKNYVDDEGRLRPDLIRVGHAPAEYALRAQEMLGVGDPTAASAAPPKPPVRATDAAESDDGVESENGAQQTPDAVDTPTERPPLPPMRSKSELAADLMRTLSPATLAGTGYIRRPKSSRWWTEL